MTKIFLTFAIFIVSFSGCNLFLIESNGVHEEGVEVDHVYWKKSYYRGVGGVYNPATKMVEWKMAPKGYGLSLIHI